jgi:hypothetical protein
MTLTQLVQDFLTLFIRGALLATALSMSLYLVGYYEFIGFFTQLPEEPALTLTAILIRGLALLGMIVFDEYLFRKKLFLPFQEWIPIPYAALLSSALYCTLKLFQFELSFMQLWTLFLIGVFAALAQKSQKSNEKEDPNFILGAARIFGILGTLSCFFGLPLFGVENLGLLLLKYQPTNWIELNIGPQLSFFLTGGSSGPLSSFALQLILVIQILRRIYSDRKILFQFNALQLK